MKTKLNNDSGFTLVELVLVMALVGLLAVTAAGPDYGALAQEGQNSQRDGVVAAVRGGINIQYAVDLVQNPDGNGTGDYPANLDNAQNDCSDGCFVNVLKDAIDSGWTKNNDQYTHVATGTTYTYTAVDGTFR